MSNYFGSALVFTVGCTTLSACREEPPTGSTPASGQRQRRWENARIVVSHDHGARCTGGFSATGQMTCGCHGGQTEIRWSFRGNSAAKDVHQVDRTAPNVNAGENGDMRKATESKKVTVDGATMKVFDLTSERVWIYPEGANPQPDGKQEREE